MTKLVEEIAEYVASQTKTINRICVYCKEEFYTYSSTNQKYAIINLINCDFEKEFYRKCWDMTKTKN